MSTNVQDEINREPRPDYDPQEPEATPAEEPKHPGWLTLAEVFNSADPFFKKFYSLIHPIFM